MVANALSRKMISGLSLKECAWRFEYDGALLAQMRVMLDLKQMIIDVGYLQIIRVLSIY